MLHPGSTVIYRDLAAGGTTQLTGEHVAVRQGANPASVLDEDLAMGAAYIDDLRAAGRTF